jgi:uncharacterized integral membrane protein
MTLFFLLAANSADNLAQVQAGFASPHNLTFSDLKVIIIILGAIIAAGIIAGIIGWRRRLARQRKMGWSSRTNPSHIW